MEVRPWHRILLGGLLVVALAAGGIALNFALLGLTQEQNDRVGKLSPRAVFDRGTTTGPNATLPSTTPNDRTTDDSDHTTTDDSGHGGGSDGDEDD